MVPDTDCSEAADSDSESDCCLIGEAVGPGFDFHDFTWVTPRMLAQLPDQEIREAVAPFLHEHVSHCKLREANATSQCDICEFGFPLKIAENILS